MRTNDERAKLATNFLSPPPRPFSSNPPSNGYPPSNALVEYALLCAAHTHLAG